LQTAAAASTFWARENGLDRLIKDIKTGLPEKLRETAYALACDVAAADARWTQEEARLLELLRFGLRSAGMPAARSRRRAARLVAARCAALARQMSRGRRARCSGRQPADRKAKAQQLQQARFFLGHLAVGAATSQARHRRFRGASPAGPS